MSVVTSPPKSDRGLRWLRQQHSELRRALMHARDHSTTERDREVISAWSEAIVIRALELDEVGLRVMHAAIARRREEERRMESPVVVVLPQAVPDELRGRQRANAYERASGRACWFPTCSKDPHHHGQHGGINDAGKRLAELEAALADGRLVWRVSA